MTGVISHDRERCQFQNPQLYQAASSVGYTQTEVAGNKATPQRRFLRQTFRFAFLPVSGDGMRIARRIATTESVSLCVQMKS
jgi:hypothetical protein